MILVIAAETADTLLVNQIKWLKSQIIEIDSASTTTKKPNLCSGYRRQVPRKHLIQIPLISKLTRKLKMGMPKMLGRRKVQQIKAWLILISRR